MSKVKSFFDYNLPDLTVKEIIFKGDDFCPAISMSIFADTKDQYLKAKQAVEDFFLLEKNNSDLTFEIRESNDFGIDYDFVQVDNMNLYVHLMTTFDKSDLLTISDKFVTNVYNAVKVRNSCTGVNNDNTYCKRCYNSDLIENVVISVDIRDIKSINEDEIASILKRFNLIKTGENIWKTQEIMLDEYGKYNLQFVVVNSEAE